MSEIIDSLGFDNFVIIIAVVVAILLALLVIFVVERINKRRHNDMDDFVDVYFDDTYSYDVSNEIDDIPVATNDVPLVDSFISNDVVYQDEVISEDKAKKTLEEVTKKLAYEDKNDLVGPTHFEVEQEERSVISYDELKKINYDIDEVNDNLLVDEGELPITIDELYKKHQEEQNVYEENVVVEVPVPLEKPTVELFDNGPKKFKNSAVISPVFGIYSGEVKQDNVSNKKSNLNDINSYALESEIKKTEEFLKELRKLKDKLD